MKILFSADWHIHLGQKGVPKAFQKERFRILIQELNQAYATHCCDLHIVGGDILDKFEPSAEELEMYFELLSQIDHPTKIYSGNHEMISKTKSVLDNMAKETSRCNSLIDVVSGSSQSPEYDILDYRDLHKKSWKPAKSKLCFTHVRGGIPPHVLPEVPLKKFSDYSLVVTGDLHSHTNTQKCPDTEVPFVYPGSPLTTSFHRNRQKGANGYLVVDTDTLGYSWYDLHHLPQLIRKTINAGEPMEGDNHDRVIYEVVGDLSELKGVENSDLLDKRIHKNVGTAAQLDLSDSKDVEEELQSWMQEVEKMTNDNMSRAISLFTSLIVKGDFE